MAKNPIPGSTPPVPPVSDDSPKDPVLAPHATQDKLAVNEPTSTAPNTAEILTPAQTAGLKPLAAPDREAARELADKELENIGPGNNPDGSPKDNLDEAQRVRADAPSASPPTEGSSPVPVPTTQEIEQARPNDAPTTIAGQHVHAPHVTSQNVVIEDPPSTAANAGDPTPVVITKEDPTHRQPGNPDDPIELPPETMPSGRSFGSSDRPMTLEEMENAAMQDARSIERRPDVVTDGVRQDPVISERTAMEMQAGRNAVDDARSAGHTPTNPVVPQVPGDAKIRSGAAFMGSENPDGTSKSYAQPPTITAQTRAEQEAGRAAVARKTADAVQGQEIMRRNAAKRLKDGAPSDPGDLNYQVPKG